MENKLEAVQDLHDWSMNFIDYRPWLVFLDLIGWSKADCCDVLADWSNPNESLGFVELDYLADALKVYAKYPNEVNDFISNVTIKDLEGGAFREASK